MCGIGCSHSWLCLAITLSFTSSVCLCKCLCVFSPPKPVLMVDSLLNPPPLFFPSSRSWALNEAGGQQQCAANWPSLLGAQAACDWSVQWGPTVQPLLHSARFHSNSQDACCTPVCLSLVSSTWGHSVFSYITSVLSGFFLFLFYFNATKGPRALSLISVTCPVWYIFDISSFIFLLVLSLYFLLLDFHSYTWFQYFLTFLGLHYHHNLSPHLPQWDSGNYSSPQLARSQE